MSWSTDLLGSKELMYDEIRFISSANVETKNDMAFITILKNEILMDSAFGGRQNAIRSTLKQTNNEYREYLSQLEAAAVNMKSWLNTSVFNGGAQFPYHPDEFITEIKFLEKSVHVMFELEEGMTGMMERQIW